MAESNNLPDNGVINKAPEPLSFLPSTDIGESFLWEIRNREKFILEMGGERVKLLKRKWEGTRCPVCWDSVRKQGESDCLSCWGTGIEGGYYLPPVEITVSLTDPASRQMEIQDHGMRLITPVRSWALWTPILLNRDVIVTKQNYRMWLNEVTPSLFRGLILHQKFTTERIEASSVLYKIPVGDFNG